MALGFDGFSLLGLVIAEATCPMGHCAKTRIESAHVMPCMDVLYMYVQKIQILGAVLLLHSSHYTHTHVCKVCDTFHNELEVTASPGNFHADTRTVSGM